MTSAEYNTWAAAQNQEVGKPQYYFSEPGGKNVIDPAFGENYYRGSASGPSMSWSSGSPNDLMYSPGGDSSSWSPLTEDMLSDEAVLKMFNQGLNTGGAAQGAYTKFNEGLSDETKGAIAGLSGSTHSLAPEVLGKMWVPQEQQPKR